MKKEDLNKETFKALKEYADALNGAVSQIKNCLKKAYMDGEKLFANINGRTVYPQELIPILFKLLFKNPGVSTRWMEAMLSDKDLEHISKQILRTEAFLGTIPGTSSCLARPDVLKNLLK